MTARRRSAPWVALSICCLGPCPAETVHAEPTATDAGRPTPEDEREATTAFLRGKESFESERFVEAEQQLQKAYRLTRDPALLYDLGQTYRKLGQCVEARQAYEQLLQAAPELPLAERARKHLADLQSCAPVTGSPGETNSSVSPAVQPGISSAPTASSATPAAGTPMASGQALVPSSERQRLVAFETATTAPAPWWAWATVVSGLAVTGTAVGLAVYNLQQRSEWTAEDEDLERGPAPGETDESWVARQNANDRLGRSIDAVRTGAVATGIAGAVLVVAAGVMFRVSTAHSSPTARAGEPLPALHLRLTVCEVTPASLGLRGVF